jgi:hypothetical protein
LVGDTDGTRTAQGGHLDSGKYPAYRGFRGRRCRPNRERGGGYRDSEQRVLRALAIGQRVGYGLRHGNTVGDADHVRSHYFGAHNVRADHVCADHTRHGPHYTGHGSHNTRYGPDHTGHGSHNTRYGPHYTGHGSHNTRYGPDHTGHGSHNTRYGPDHTGHGSHNTRYRPHHACHRPDHAHAD